MKYLLFLALALTGFSQAHSYLKTSTPAENETVTRLENIELTFTENVQVPFSFFKVYKLADTGNLSDEKERLRLNGQAGLLINDVLTKTDDEAARADAGITTSENQTNVITLALKEDLSAGIYVVMWRVLSVDTHTTQGSFLFTYQP
jgi:methionine-rich copper-binding protein CopC